MKNIQIIYKGLDYIKVEFDRNDTREEVEITGEAIQIIEVLCRALHKPFPVGYEMEEN